MVQSQAEQLSMAPAAGQLAPERPAAVAGGQPVTLPTERRPSWSTLAFLAVMSGVAAVALGTWALLGGDDSPQGASSTRSLALERAVAVIADPRVERIPFTGSVGRIVLLVGRRGDAVLMLNGLAPAAAGQRYQAWVTLPGSGELLAAGLFDGSEPFVALSHLVTPGVRVSVTLEDEDGATTPSRRPRLSAARA